MRRFLSPLAVVAMLASVGVPDARAQDDSATTRWQAEKCDRYAKGWRDALARKGRVGLSQDFLDRHAVFLASGCVSAHDVCPRSMEELDLANIMVVVAMNAGTASTFAPFACRR